MIVTGSSYGSSLSDDYATVAYSARNGDVLWTKRFGSREGGSDLPVSIAVNPDGSTVYVTGEGGPGGDYVDYLTIAYDTSDGSRIWTRRYDGPSHSMDYAVAIAVSPDGSTVVVAGSSESIAHASDYATIAYDATSGTKVWSKRYVGPELFDDAVAMVVSPIGSAVFVTGNSRNVDEAPDWATVAYAI